MAGEKLTRETVIEQALALADAEGVEGVTIRRLASRLGVTPMALYWHFKHKDELLGGLAEFVLAGVTAAVSPGDSWQKRLRAMVEAIVRVMRMHPCLPDLLAVVEVKNDIESFKRATELSLELLTTAGFTLNESYDVAGYLLNGAVALVKSQPYCPPNRSAAEEAESRRQHKLRLESLPPDRYPHMIAYGATLGEPPDRERYFAFGVDLLLAGIEAMAADKTRVPAGRERCASPDGEATAPAGGEPRAPAGGAV
ncbi:TetR family transcriptional regulator [Sphaerisporangium corydalis]|uniref:TetR family transcriptional regulator n=1 Tax=Sphaerisporangium corydalis TaxID=1441875 RepID=A0ABV9EM06_9ACTN|nr:TetR family transcriptional regulator [Sphaerisporangium corydalis]